MQQLDDRLIPLDAERHALGACLIDGDAIYLVADELTPDDFYRESHRLIWATMLDLYRNGRPVNDITLLTDKLGARGELENAGGEGYLLELITETPTAVHARHYAEIVAEKAERRRLVLASGKLAAWAHDAEIEEPAAKALGELLKVSDRRDGLVQSDEAWAGYLDLLGQREAAGGVIGLETGFFDLDRALGGLRDDNLIIIGGRPGMGKTTLAECIADNVAAAGRRVLFVSLEMPLTKLQDRRMVRWLDVPLRDLERGRHIDAVAREIGRRGAERIDYVDDAGLTTDRLLSLAYRARATTGLDLVVLDYLQLLNDDPGTRGNETLRITYISRRLKLLARELHIPVVVLSQLNRAVEHRNDKRPTLADLRQSGSIEQDADAVVLMYREAYYDLDCGHNVTDLELAKNRHGPTSEIQLLFQPAQCQFVNLEQKPV